MDKKEIDKILAENIARVADLRGRIKNMTSVLQVAQAELDVVQKWLTANSN